MLVNKRNLPACLCSSTVPWSVVICISGRWCNFQEGMARPVVHAPVPWLHPHSKTVPESEIHVHAEMWSAKGNNGIASSHLNEMQNKSSIANKLVAMEMEIMFCKLIAFALFHLYFAILYFCLQKAHLFFLNTFIFICKILFYFAIFQLFCKYMWHWFDFIQ